MFGGKKLQCIKIIKGGTGHDLASFWPVNPFASGKAKKHKQSFNATRWCLFTKTYINRFSGVVSTKYTIEMKFLSGKCTWGVKIQLNSLTRWAWEQGPIEQKGSIALEVTMVTNIVWNSLCHGPDITRNEPVFFWKTEIWRDIGFGTRSVYIEYRDPYSFWIELFPRHGISGHVIETPRVKTCKCPYFSRHAEYNYIETTTQTRWILTLKTAVVLLTSR